VKSKRYLVTGKRQYRWHKPGSIFEARLDPNAEERAIERGSIRVIDSIQPELENGSYALPPEDWPQAVADEGTTRDASVSRAIS
jgi:hypothetical protein